MRRLCSISAAGNPKLVIVMSGKALSSSSICQTPWPKNHEKERYVTIECVLDDGIRWCATGFGLWAPQVSRGLSR
jgi:hypothetical protein